MADIRFGPWSVTLLIFAGQTLVIAAALLVRRRDRRANAWLAGLLIVLAGMLTPFIIGYAGFYDAYPWLSFAPFAIPLAMGPFLYGHVHAVVRGRAIHWCHALLPGSQFVWQMGCFVQPLPVKLWIDTEIQAPFVSPLTRIAVILSMGSYALASLHLLRGARPGAKRGAALGRLRLTVAAILMLVVARAGFDLYDALVAPLDYFDLFAFYLLLALIATVLAIEGWRGSAVPLPSFAPAAERGWQAQASDWEARLRSGGWWRDAGLDLQDLARRLGTNASYLSRALNEGLRTSFADFIGGIRAEAVAARLDSGDDEDLLELALDAGFGSKASFNRAFLKRFGQTPSSYRRASKAEKLVSARI